MDLTDTQRHALSRRGVLVVGAGTAAGAALLAACGGGGDSSTSTSGSSSSAGAGGGSDSLAKVADVPVGGAVSATDAAGKPVIVSQPTEGDIVAFSAICTHKGCTVAPQGGEIKCPCHGSTYDLTGKNTGGPAPAPLAKVSVTVSGGEVVES